MVNIGTWRIGLLRRDGLFVSSRICPCKRIGSLWTIVVASQLRYVIFFCCCGAFKGCLEELLWLPLMSSWFQLGCGFQQDQIGVVRNLFVMGRESGYGKRVWGGGIEGKNYNGSFLNFWTSSLDGPMRKTGKMGWGNLFYKKLLVYSYHWKRLSLKSHSCLLAWLW